MIELTRIFVAASIVMFATPALADEFGKARVIALSSDANVSFQYSSVSPGSASTTTFLLEPALDVFVSDKLSVGGFAVFESASTSTGMMTGSGSSTTVGAGPRIGYNVDFSSKLSFWPKVGLTLDSVSVNGASDSHVMLSASGRVLFRPVAHFFVGFGPDLNADLTGTYRSTTLGLAFTVGGWL
jgi:hypothetical protein